MEDLGRYSAEGYSFFTEKDAALAENEKRKVEYLEARLDYNNPDSILRVYNKAIEERIFKSPVGYFFLKGLQDYLKRQPGIADENVQDIPMHVSFDPEFREQAAPARNRVRAAELKPEPKPKNSAAFPVSLILNGVLIAAVIAMFYITLNSEQPNILNYEKALTNRYATWEQQLTERERAVREKERALNIENE